MGNRCCPGNTTTGRVTCESIDIRVDMKLQWEGGREEAGGGWRRRVRRALGYIHVAQRKGMGEEAAELLGGWTRVSCSSHSAGL